MKYCLPDRIASQLPAKPNAPQRAVHPEYRLLEYFRGARVPEKHQ